MFLSSLHAVIVNETNRFVIGELGKAKSEYKIY